MPGDWPDLGALVEAHGGYLAIPPRAWVAYDEAVRRWKAERGIGVVEPARKKKPGRRSPRSPANRQGVK